jgi:hypothetical protein
MKKRARMAVVLLAGGIIGYLVGPPVVQAATNVVTIKDPQTPSKARVTQGNLWTDASGSVVYALTEPLGEVLLISGNNDNSKSGSGDLTGVSMNVSSAGSSPVTINVRKGTSSSGVIIWQGTVEGIGHLHDVFEQAVTIASGFNVQVLNSGGASLHYEVYGCCFGVKAAPVAAPRLVESKPVPQLPAKTGT